MKDNTFLNRRSFIKNAACAGLLSTVQCETLLAQTTAPLRFVFIPLQHGWGTGASSLESITGSEYDFTLPGMWQPFNAIKHQSIFIDGLRGTFWGNAHDVSYSDILTAAVPIEAPESDKLKGPFPLPTGPSIDHVLAEMSGKPALRFSAGFQSWGAAWNPISFNDRIELLPFYTNAFQAYESLFALNNGGQLNGLEANLFSHLNVETQQLIGKTYSGERNKLLQYFDAMNALAKKRVGDVNGSVMAAQLSSIPKERQTVGENIDSFFEMLKVSFMNDTSRVAIVGFGESVDDFAWTNEAGEMLSGYSVYTGNFHHDIAHYDKKPRDAELAYLAWTKYYAQKVADFVLELEQITDVDGKPMIDNTIFVLTGEVGNGQHDRRHKPHIVIGGGERLKRGRWYQTPRADATTIGGRDINGKYHSIKETTTWMGGNHSQFSHADLFVKLARLAGSNMSQFGIDSMNVQALDI